jgi:hypothetical protein
MAFGYGSVPSKQTYLSSIESLPILHPETCRPPTSCSLLHLFIQQYVLITFQVPVSILGIEGLEMNMTVQN